MTAVDTFRYARFGVESTYHTVAAAALDIESISNGLDSPDNPEVVIDSGMGRAPKTKVPGFYSSSGPIEYHPDIESIGWFWRWFLTGYQFTTGGGAPTPNTHEIYGTSSKTLKSITVREGKDNWEQIFLGCMLNTLDLKVDTSAQVATCTLGWIGGKDYPGSIQSAGALTLPSDIPLGFAEATVWIDEEDNSALMKSLTLSANNNIDAKSAQRFGSMFPQGGFIPGQTLITFNAQLVFEDKFHKNLFWGSETGAATTGSALTPITFRLTDPDATRYLNMCAPSCHIQSVKTTTRGSETLVQDIVGRAFIAEDVTLADASMVDTEFLVTLLNNTATMA